MACVWSEPPEFIVPLKQDWNWAGGRITGAHVQYLTHPSFVVVVVVVVVVAALTHGGWCADHRLWTSSVPSA